MASCPAFKTSCTSFIPYSTIITDSDIPLSGSPINDPNKPDWEIRRRRAGRASDLSKRNELGLMSNFAPTPLSSQPSLREPQGFCRYALPRGRRIQAKFLAYAVHPATGRPMTHDAKSAGTCGKIWQRWASTGDLRGQTGSSSPTREHYRLIVEATAKVDQNPIKRVLLAKRPYPKTDHHGENPPPMEILDISHTSAPGTRSPRIGVTFARIIKPRVNIYLHTVHTTLIPL